MNITTPYEVKMVSYAPVVTGFSATTALNGYYTLEGKRCIVTLDILGTSNTTAFTVTLPFIADPNLATAGLFDSIVRGINNGTNVTSWVRTRNGSSNILDVFQTTGTTTWTGSGTKGLSATLVYYVE